MSSVAVEGMDFVIGLTTVNYTKISAPVCGLAFSPSNVIIDSMPLQGEEPLLLEILDEQDELVVDLEKVRSVCEHILAEGEISSGKINVVLVDSNTIQQFNRDFLCHDYPTDTISFPTEDRRSEGYLEGEVLACTEVAKERSEEFGWTAEEELFLYIIHGMLHLIGFDDDTPELRTVMQEKERYYLATLGIQVPSWNWDDWDDTSP
jgi:probable rRNA maturation factor